MIDMRDALTELLSEFGAKESKDGRKCNEEQLISGNGEGLYKDVGELTCMGSHVQQFG